MTSPRHCAVIGNPIDHSRSPFIHEQFAKQTGLALRYDKIRAQAGEFDAVVADFFRRGGVGLNVTLPFKGKAYALARPRLDDSATLALAVNTLYRRDDALCGANTDGGGLLADLERLRASPADKRVLLIGAGGAARGIVAPLLLAGCGSLRIVNRHAERAHALRRQVQEALPTAAARLSSGGLDQSTGDWDVVINATSGSLTGEVPDIADARYAPGALAYDLVYAAGPTAFMVDARDKGARVVSDGLGMLVAQAAESFAIWHGLHPATAPVLAALRQALDAERR